MREVDAFSEAEQQKLPSDKNNELVSLNGFTLGFK